MSSTINQVYIDEFNAYLRLLAQQEFARLRPKVYEVSSGGESYSFDRVGATEATQKTTRAQATPINQYPFSRRVATAKTFNCGELIEQEDQIQAKVSIKGGLVRSMAASMARSYDDEIIRAFGSTALDGDGASIPFPAGQVVGDGTTPISFDMVTAVQELFLQNDIQGEVLKCFVVGPTQVRKLLQLTEQTSSDFVSREALMRLSQGLIVPNWMGFSWICSTRLLAPAVGELDCYAFTERAIGLAENRGITTFVQQDPSVSFAWRLYSQATFGAVRTEDEQIVRVHVLDSL
jgi:hypothetical protein